MYFVDLVLQVLSWVTGEVVELRRVCAAPYPSTLTEELDVLESLHGLLLDVQRLDGCERIKLSLCLSKNRPFCNSRISLVPVEFILPNNVLDPYRHIGGHGESDKISIRHDIPQPHSRYDYRECAVTMRAWETIKAEMPEAGTVILDRLTGSLAESGNRMLLGTYGHYAGRIFPSSTVLDVFVRPIVSEIHEHN